MIGSPEEDGPEEADEEEGDFRGNPIFVTPVAGRLAMALPSGAGPAMDRSGPVSLEWVKFFEHWLDQTPKGSSPSRRRIILLESIEAMSSTFDQWWPSLVEAVRLRRRSAAPNGKQGRVARPTTIVFASSPSLLLPHTAPSAISTKDQESAVKSMHPMLQEIADRLGGTVETKVENNETGPLWWGSEEVDATGRRERNGRRLAALLDENG
jgi:hypothetical protein